MKFVIPAIAASLLFGPALAVGQEAVRTIAAAPLEDIQIGGSRVTREVTCDGRDVMISGEAHNITLRGNCQDVAIGGFNHRVTMVSAAGLQVSGSANQVTVSQDISGLEMGGSQHRVSTGLRKAAEEPAQVMVSGEGSVVNLRLEGRTRIEVGGMNQRIMWSKPADVPEPEGVISGLQNVVARAEAQ